MKKVCFNWAVADYFGWGVYGYNLLIYGRTHPTLEVSSLTAPSFLYPLSPIASSLLSQYKPRPNARLELEENDVFLNYLGVSNRPLEKAKFRDIGVIFSEANPMADQEIRNLKEYEFIVAGSSWNAAVLEEAGIKTRTVIQGIDTDLFRPSPKRYFKNRFVVFSGGKLEYRKGQDLVLKAFARFAAKHPDALLVTAWRSQWEESIAPSVNHSNVCEPLHASPDMGSSTYDWILRNGVMPNQVLCLDTAPNRLMPDVFREVDLAVFPNRCEAGTNLVAMEALAFGLPCLISQNTGHLDIIQKDNAIPLTLQRPIDGLGATGWGESSVDEIVDRMEEAYQGRLGLDPDVVRGSMLNYSWERSINQLLGLFVEG
jgi:glycosyltransferase involved in cell wall biosynthesis